MASREAHPPQPEKIAPLTNIAPCVFTPLTDDITKPLEEPLDRIGRLKRIIEAIDAERAAVQENLMWMVDRERQRIIQQAQAAEEAEGLAEIRPGLPTDEADRIITSMMVRGDSHVDYSLQELHSPSISQLPQARPEATHRERALHDIMLLVEKTLDQLTGHDNAISIAKREYVKRLEAEQWRFGTGGGGQSQDQTMADAGPM